MKNAMLLLVVLIAASVTVNAQKKKWADLTKEEKMMKAQAFRDDNQKYLKGLGLTEDQLSDIDNVNLCYLSTLDRIDRYGGDDAAKEKYAKTATSARSSQLDAIMGADKRKQYQTYVEDKLKKAADR